MTWRHGRAVPPAGEVLALALAPAAGPRLQPYHWGGGGGLPKLPSLCRCTLLLDGATTCSAPQDPHQGPLPPQRLLA